MSQAPFMESPRPSTPRPSAWKALWWVVTRPPNPLEPSSRSLLHPVRFFPWLALAAVVWACAFFPFWSMVSFSKSIESAPNAGSIIAAALDTDRVRGNQRRFLEALGAGTLSPPTDSKISADGLASLSLPVHVRAPEPMASALYQVLATHGISPAESDCGRCVVVAWKNSREGAAWSAQVKPSSLLYPEHPQAPALDAKELSTSVEKLVRQAVARLPSSSPITLAPDSLEESLREGLKMGSRFGAHLLALVISWLVIVGASASVGATWDRRRTHGELEVLVGAFHPPWVSYLGLVFRSLTVVLLIYLALLIVLFVFRLPVHWPLLLALIPVVVSAVVFLGLWSIFLTTLFHHPRGRSFAQFLLSPLTLSVVWVIRVGMVWAALKASQPLRFIDGFESALSAWPWVWAVLPLLWLGSVLLWLLIQWRMGRRREGLREAKKS